MHQHGATFVFTLEANQVGLIEQALLEPHDLSSIETIHYASFSLVPIGDKPHNLLIEVNFDGELKTLLPRLTKSKLIASVMNSIGIPEAYTTKSLSGANKGEGFLFNALPGLTALEVKRDNELLNVVRQQRSTLKSRNAREIVEELTRIPSVEKVLASITVNPLPKKTHWLELWVFLAAFIASTIVCLGSSVSLQPIPWHTFLMAASVTLITGCFFAGIVLFYFSDTLPRRILSIMAAALSLGIGYLTILQNHIELHTWIAFLLVILSIPTILIFTISRVSGGDFLDRFVARFGFVLTILLLGLFSISMFDSIAQTAVTLFLISLVVLGLLFVSLKTPLSARVGILLGIVSAVVVSDLLPPLLSYLSTLLTISLILGFGILLHLFCEMEKGERSHEEKPATWIPEPHGDRLLLQEASQAHHLRHLLSITRVKAGRQRLLHWTLKYIFFYNELRGKRGELSGITTIHFARWIDVDDHLVFLSNYDHAWGAYLDEFIDQASAGLTTIWTHTQGFPLTHWLASGGAEYAQRFKAYARQSQHPNLLHYSAYPELSVDDIEEAENLKRILLSKEPTDSDCEYVVRII